MRTIYLRILLGSLLAVPVLSSCSDDEKQVPKDMPVKELPPSPSELSVAVKEGNKTSTSVELVFTPSNEKDKYVSLVVPTAAFSAVKPEELSAMALKELSQKAAAESKTLSEYLTSVEHSGTFTQNVTGLTPFTKYNVVTFLRKGEQQLDSRVRNEKFFFQTAVADAVQLSFENHVIVQNATTALLEVKPSDKKMDYFVCNFPKNKYDEMVNDKKMTDADIITGFFTYQLMNSLNTGTPEEVKTVVGEMQKKDDQFFPLPNLQAETEYVYLMGAFVVPDYNHVTLISNVTKGTFSTLPAEKIVLTPMNFTSFEVTRTGETSFSVNIVPEDPMRTYLWRQGILTKEYKRMTPMELANTLLHQGFYPMPPFFLNRGTQAFDNLPILPGNAYFVIAFGTDGRNVTSEPTLKKFETGSPVNPMNTTFEIVKNSIRPYSANLTFKASDKGVFYAFALLKDADNKTEDMLKNEFQKDLDSFSKQWLSINKGFDMTDFLSSNYFNGDQPYVFNNLTPDTSYSVYTIVIGDDGKIVKVNRQKSFLTTPRVSAAVLEPSLFGVFNMDEVGDDLIPGASKFKGAGVALVVAKYEFKKGAEKGESCFIPKSFREWELDSNRIPDAVVLQKIANNLYKITKEQPYGFFVCRWNDTQVALSYAYDAAGNNGVIDRRIIGTPTKDDVMSIDKLKTLIDSFPGEEASSAHSADNAAVNNMMKYVPTVVPRKVGQAVKELPGRPVVKERVQKFLKKQPSWNNSQDIDLPVFTVVK